MKLQRRTLNTLNKTAEVLDVLGNIIDDPEREEANDENGLHEIPKNRLYGVDLKAISAFKLMRQTYKLDNDRSVFLRDVQGILDHLPPDDHKFSVDLLLMVLNIGEEFYIYGDLEKRKESKRETVHTLMLPYFSNDVKLLDTVILLVDNRVIKSTRLKRIVRRLSNFFF
jgi:hypothetical protein